jgi:predicted NBD/HSP70 family sugar kinase
MNGRYLHSAPATAGELLQAIRAADGATRAVLAARTGLPRAALNQRLALLSRHGLVVADGHERSTGGRPPAHFSFNVRAGAVLGIDIGITAARVGVADLAGSILGDRAAALPVQEGPDVVLGWVVRQAEELLQELGIAESELWGVGAGVPGPVEFEQGRVVNPPMMPGWQQHPIRDWLSQRFGCPAVVDKDANIMALGEYRSSWSHLRHILFVKAGTGIGCGIIADGRVHRGANGAAGDIGHIQVNGYGDPPCTCGNTGCVEATAGGWALVRDLQAQGLRVRTAADVAKLASRGERRALHALRQAGRVLGEALSDAVNFFNPAVVALGGSLVQDQGELLAGTREVVYQRSLTLATRDLQVVTSSLGFRAGIVGAARLITERILTPHAVDKMLSSAADSASATHS